MKTLPPSYRVTGSAVPWKAIIGMGRADAHFSDVIVRAVATAPIAAIRSAITQDNRSDIPAPFDRPLT